MADARAQVVPLRSATTRAFAAVALIVSAYVAFIFVRGELGIDTYKAFYCAGTIVLHGGNPYLMEPLRTCEHAVYTSPIFPAFAVEPAPLPTYALSGFALLALLPPHASHAVFVALLLVALIVTAWALAEITEFPPALLLLVCLPMWIMSVAYGEIPPFAVAAIALCGLALQRKNAVAAAVFACIAMIQPHVALPLCASLFLFVPRARVPLAIGAIALAAIGILTGGVQTALAYYTTYLPAHAASEVIATDQYSLTHVLHIAGVSDRVALRLGFVSYAVMAVLGIFAGWRLSKSLKTPAFLAFAPPAFVLLGGSFMHDTQIYAALPLALTLLARAPSTRWLVAIALALLCVTWTQVESRFVLLSVLVASFALGYLLFRSRSSSEIQADIRSAALAVAITIAVLAVNRLPAASMSLDSSPHSPKLSAASPASDGWNALLRASPFWSVPSPRSEGRKIPTWIGLAFLVAAALRRQPSENG